MKQFVRAEIHTITVNAMISFLGPQVAVDDVRVVIRDSRRCHRGLSRGGRSVSESYSMVNDALFARDISILTILTWPRKGKPWLL